MITFLTLWITLAPGVEKAVLPGEVVVVRVDPTLWNLSVAAGSGRSAQDWAKERGMMVATNAGMFFGTTHVGYLEVEGRVISRHANGYLSAAAFSPKRADLVPFRIFDLDEVSLEEVRRDYRTVIQNLRIIKRRGEVRWQRRDARRWSEAALGEDDKGRILFIFSRKPFSMYDLSMALLSSGVGVVALQHLEGGPEAQLYLRGDLMVGSYETGFNESTDNRRAWPIPNVIGVVSRSP